MMGEHYEVEMKKWMQKGALSRNKGGWTQRALSCAKYKGGWTRKGIMMSKVDGHYDIQRQ